MMADLIEKDLSNEEGRYTNPPNCTGIGKRLRPDLSNERAEWIKGCSAATARRDVLPPPPKQEGER